MKREKTVSRKVHKEAQKDKPFWSSSSSTLRFRNSILGWSLFTVVKHKGKDCNNYSEELKNKNLNVFKRSDLNLDIPCFYVQRQGDAKCLEKLLQKKVKVRYKVGTIILRSIKINYNRNRNLEI